HGNPEHLKMKLFPDDPRAFLHEDLLTRNSGNLKIPAAVDEQTEVYFRSCNAGLNQELIDVLKTTCFPDARFVKIPKWPQGYEFETENKRDASGKPTKQVVTVATEFFLEQLHFERPTPAEAKRDAAIEFPKSFDRIKTRSPGLSATASYADEEASYR